MGPESSILCCNNDRDPPAGPQPVSSDVVENRSSRVNALLAEDNKTDVLMIEEAIEQHGLPIDLHVVEDGTEACAFIDRADQDSTAPCPEILLLDLNLPRRTGKEVLMHLRRSKKCSAVPVVIITSSDSAPERDEIMKLGATRYFRKPASFDGYIKVGSILKEVLEARKTH